MNTNRKRRTLEKRIAESNRLLEDLVGPVTFGKLIWSIRKCEELTQESFAKRLRVSKYHLSDIENDRRNVSPERAAKFAKILRYDVAHFVELALQGTLERAGIKEFKVRLEKLV